MSCQHDVCGSNSCPCTPNADGWYECEVKTEPADPAPDADGFINVVAPAPADEVIDLTGEDDDASTTGQAGSIVSNEPSTGSESDFCMSSSLGTYDRWPFPRSVGELLHGFGEQAYDPYIYHWRCFDEVWPARQVSDPSEDRMVRMPYILVCMNCADFEFVVYNDSGYLYQSEDAACERCNMNARKVCARKGSPMNQKCSDRIIYIPLNRSLDFDV